MTPHLMSRVRTCLPLISAGVLWMASACQQKPLPSSSPVVNPPQETRSLLMTLVRTVQKEIVTKNTLASQPLSTPAFRTCVDWHSAAHCYWATFRVARATRDPEAEAIAQASNAALSADVLEKEFASNFSFPHSNPDQVYLELPYGQAWFLLLAAEHHLWATERGLPESDRMLPYAQKLADFTFDALGSAARSPMRMNYSNDTWAILRLYDFLTAFPDLSPNNRARAETLRRWFVELTHARAKASDGTVIPVDFFLDDPVRSQAQFFSRFGLMLHAAETLLSADEARTFLAGMTVTPEELEFPTAPHPHLYQWGLVWSRLFGLESLKRLRTTAAMETSEAIENAILFHHRLGRLDYEAQQSNWRYSHWVPQFAIYALTQGYRLEAGTSASTLAGPAPSPVPPAPCPETQTEFRRLLIQSIITEYHRHRFWQGIIPGLSEFKDALSAVQSYTVIFSEDATAEFADLNLHEVAVELSKRLNENTFRPSGPLARVWMNLGLHDQLSLVDLAVAYEKWNLYHGKPQGSLQALGIFPAAVDAAQPWLSSLNTSQPFSLTGGMTDPGAALVRALTLLRHPKIGPTLPTTTATLLQTYSTPEIMNYADHFPLGKPDLDPNLPFFYDYSIDYVRSHLRGNERSISLLRFVMDIGDESLLKAYLTQHAMTFQVAGVPILNQSSYVDIVRLWTRIGAIRMITRAYAALSLTPASPDSYGSLMQAHLNAVCEGHQRYQGNPWYEAVTPAVGLHNLRL